MISLANLERQQILKRSFWALVILRGFLNAVIPLMDKTEAILSTSQHLIIQI